MTNEDFNLLNFRRMSDNGYILLAALPGEKSQPTIGFGYDADTNEYKVTKENYSFTRAFKKPGWYDDSKVSWLNCNGGNLCLDIVAVCDFDAHENDKGEIEHPNGVDLYNKIMGIMPELFTGCIIEKTTRCGYHVYFKGLPMEQAHPYTVIIEIDGIKAEVEVLAGYKISWCWPTILNDGRHYEIISEHNFLNTKPGELPELPALFRKPPTAKKEWNIEGYTLENITSNDLEFIIDHYKNRRYGYDNSNNDARVLARILLGLGLSAREVERHVEDYIRRNSKKGQLHDKGEAKRLVDYAIRKGVGEPAIPFKELIAWKRRRINNVMEVR